MTRLILVVSTTFISMIAHSQDTTFDNKVEQLFFNVNVEKPSLALIGKFKKVPALTYKRPQTITHSLNGKFWTHNFTFNSLPFLTSKFDMGSIELGVVQWGSREKGLHELTWRLKFLNKEDAMNVFNELKMYFAETQAISKVYASDLALQTAEFTNTNSKKYPYIMFMLFDKTNAAVDSYQILFSLDNDTHYEK